MNEELVFRVTKEVLSQGKGTPVPQGNNVRKVSVHPPGSSG